MTGGQLVKTRSGLPEGASPRLRPPLFRPFRLAYASPSELGKGEFDLFWTPILLRQAEARRGPRRSLPHFEIDCLIQVTLRIGKGITYKGLSRCQCNRHHLCRPDVIILTHPVRAKIRIKYSQLGLDLPCQIPGLQLLKLQPSKATFLVPSRRLIPLF